MKYLILLFIVIFVGCTTWPDPEIIIEYSPRAVMYREQGDWKKGNMVAHTETYVKIDKVWYPRTQVEVLRIE